MKPKPWMRVVVNPEVRALGSNPAPELLLVAYRRVWARKRSLRRTYETWYRRIDRWRVPGKIVEIGAGTGNFKEWMSHPVRAVDILRAPWIDVQADSLRLPFRSGSVENVVAIDVLHHLPDPAMLFDEVGRILRSGGRLLMLEPFVSPWGRFVWGGFHHEEVDAAAAPDGGDPWEGRLGVSRELLDTDLSQLPVSITHVEYGDWLAYPLCGGFSYRALLPGGLLQLLSLVERLPPFRSRLLALRAFMVFSKADSRPAT